MRANNLKELGLSPRWTRRQVPFSGANRAAAVSEKRDVTPDSAPELARRDPQLDSGGMSASRGDGGNVGSGAGVTASSPIPTSAGHPEAERFASNPAAGSSDDDVRSGAPVGSPDNNGLLNTHLLTSDEQQNPTQTAATPAEVTAEPPPTNDSQLDAQIAKMQWQPLREAVAECTRCGLSQARTQTVFGVGDTEADIVFVGEGPGQEEDRQGEPFVGAAGKLLDAMLKSIGMERGAGVYIANIVKCRPPQNRKPKPEESHACLPFLHRQLELIQPKLIVAMGGVASANLLNIDEPVGKLRQRLHDYRGIPVVVTYHPAYLLRAPVEKRKSWNDLRLIRRLHEGANENDNTGAK